jgi:anti-anti-sigma factor
MNATLAFPIAGELTIYRAAELCESLKTALAGLADGADLEIDLSAVTEMDSAGAQLLMAVHKSTRASNNGLRLVNPSAAVDEVFETLQLAPHFAGAY